MSAPGAAEPGAERGGAGVVVGWAANAPASVQARVWSPSGWGALETVASLPGDLPLLARPTASANGGVLRPTNV